GVAELHSAKNNLNPLTALTESGEIPKGLSVLTGTLPDGTAAVDATCENWTSDDNGSAALGLGRTVNKSNSCKQQDLQAAGTGSGFYCFAAGLAPPRLSDAGPARGAATQILSDDEGETFLNTLCASCHSLERVKNKKATADQWGQIVDRMKGKGITLTDDDTN